VAWLGVHAKWEPLDTPISLSRGNVHTREFIINMRSTYRIAFVAHGGFGHQSSDGAYYDYCPPAVGASWSLSSHGQVVATGAEQRCDELGSFHVGSGRYVLDVDVSRDGRQLRFMESRLLVYEDGGVHEMAYNWSEMIFWTFFALITLGAGILVFSAISTWNQKLDRLGSLINPH
jgi:hypothetical protein